VVPVTPKTLKFPFGWFPPWLGTTDLLIKRLNCTVDRCSGVRYFEHQSVWQRVLLWHVVSRRWWDLHGVRSPQVLSVRSLKTHLRPFRVQNNGQRAWRHDLSFGLRASFVQRRLRNRPRPQTITFTTRAHLSRLQRKILSAYSHPARSHPANIW